MNLPFPSLWRDMNIQCLHRNFVAVVAVAAVFACQSEPGPEIGEPAPQGTAATPANAHVVDVIAEDYAFDAPAEIPSGWVTFRLSNEGEETHFVYLTRLQEDRTYDEYVGDVAAPLNEVWTELRAGEIDKAEAGQQLGGVIPAWYWTDAVSMGGPGMVAAGGTSQATVNLEPGTYVMECFMKTSDGELHWVEGMIQPFTVTGESSGAPEPEADIRMTISTDGYRTEGELTPGVHRIQVNFGEQPEGFGNDVHLVRLEEGMQAQELVPWMDFLNVEGLQNPAPAPFRGGVQERPEGHTAYFTVALETGRYAWIAESPEERQLFEEFVVR